MTDIVNWLISQIVKQIDLQHVNSVGEIKELYVYNTCKRPSLL